MKNKKLQHFLMMIMEWIIISTWLFFLINIGLKLTGDNPFSWGGWIAQWALLMLYSILWYAQCHSAQESYNELINKVRNN